MSVTLSAVRAATLATRQGMMVPTILRLTASAILVLTILAVVLTALVASVHLHRLASPRSAARWRRRT